MDTKEDYAVKALYRAAIRLDPYLPKEARGKSIATRFDALHSQTRKSHISEESLKGLENQIVRHMRAASGSDIWLKTSYYLILSTVRSIRKKVRVHEQKQHRIPVCMLARFAPDPKAVKGRQPMLPTARLDRRGYVYLQNLPAGEEFIYEIPGMNHPAVEQFFSLIEGNSYMSPAKSVEDLHYKLGFVMLQRVRLRTEASREAGTFRYVWKELEAEFRSVHNREVALIGTQKAFPISRFHMNRHVRLADGSEAVVFPHRKQSIIVLHDGLSQDQIHRAIKVARGGSIHRPLVRGEKIYGLNKDQIRASRKR